MLQLELKIAAKGGSRAKTGLVTEIKALSEDLDTLAARQNEINALIIDLLQASAEGGAGSDWIVLLRLLQDDMETPAVFRNGVFNREKYRFYHGDLWSRILLALPNSKGT